MLSSSTRYQIVFLNSFPFDWYVIPLLLLGALMSPCAPFQRVNNEKTRKNEQFLSDCLLSPAILARWHQPSSSVLALDPLYQAMCAVLYRRTTMAIKMASKYGALFIVFLLHATPLSDGMIRSEYLPNGGVQWLLVKLWIPSIRRCTRHCTGVSSRPSKRVATVVYCFASSISTSTITVDNIVVILI